MDFNEPSEGCPRCQDYDDIKSELDDLKDIREEEKQSALDDCNSNRQRLQKKLTWAGAAALVGATILGQEFIDSVANRVEGVKKIVDVADDVVSMAPQTTKPQQKPQTNTTPKSNEDEEDVKDEPRKEFNPYGGDPFAIVDSNVYNFDYMEDYNDSMLDSLDEISSAKIADMINLPSPRLGYDSQYPYDFLTYDGFYLDPSMYEPPMVFQSQPPYIASVVPEPPVLFCLLGLMLLQPRRKRQS